MSGCRSRTPNSSVAGPSTPISAAPPGRTRTMPSPSSGTPATEPLAATRRSRSEEHTSELQSLMRSSYAVLCLKKKNNEKKYEQQEDQRKNNEKHRAHGTHNKQTQQKIN